MKCSKGGVKIYPTDNNTAANNAANNPSSSITHDNQLEFYNKIKGQNKHTGVRIENDAKNEYALDPFDGANPFNNPEGDEPLNTTKPIIKELDLNIDNYSQRELYKLFGITTQHLNEDILKICKRTVLKTHPDKSGIDQKYFLFFSKAYKRLYAIYEFQNKTARNRNTEYSQEENVNASILDKMFEQNKSLKKGEHFNKWFNDEFDKHKLEDDNEGGYGDWLKSEQDMVNLENVSKADMPRVIDEHKKHVQTITKYNGIDTQYASTFGGSTLMNCQDNYTSDVFNSDGVGYTDLKQAYVESVIPITEDDYHKLPKFNSVDEYNRYRDSVDTKPIEKNQALRQLYEENKTQEEQSVALAFHYARQAEKVKQNKETFWSSLKQLTG